MASSFRAPWTAAIVLLIMIWTVHFIKAPGSSQTDTTVSEIDIERTKLIIEGVAKPDETPVTPIIPADEPEIASEPALAAPIAHEAPKPPPAQAVKPDLIEDDLVRVSPIDSDTPQFARTTPIQSKAAPKPTPKTVALLAEQTDRPLVTYVYSQTDSAEANLRFFVAHALNAAADFIFVINGETAQAREIIPKKENVKIIERPNDCYDLGSHAEILTTKVPVEGKDGKVKKVERWKSYKRFILLNASIRGPFMPNWSNGCWMDAYLSKLNEEVKLVGMTANCWPQFHVQSMIWATDSVGISLLLYPPQPDVIPEDLPDDWKEVGINGCFHTWDEAVHAEVFSTAIIRNAGYNISVMMSAFYSDEEYIGHCDSGGNGDVLWNGRYFGTNIHPYETIFMKTNRDIDPVLIDKLSAWKTGEGYSSYDHC